MRGSFKHQLMMSCLLASFELNTKGTPYTFTPQHEVAKKGTIIQVDGDTVSPDAVFKLSKEGKDVLIFLEVDRGTEPTETGALNRKSWTRSINQYKKLIGSRLYKDIFNVDCGALLLIVTISEAKQNGILKVVKDTFNGPCNFILTHHLPEFGRAFHPPKKLNMLGTVWKRCEHPDFVFHK